MEALGDTLTGHVKGLRRYAIALTGDPIDADDLVQESVARVLAKIEEGAEVRNLRTYLFSTLHNLRMDQLSRKRITGIQVPLEDVAAKLSSPANQQARLLGQDMADSLAKLPEQQREILLLIGLEGASYQDAADILEIPLGTVMSRVSRARETLRRLMAGGPLAGLHRVK
ncbi:sigma-70 family RNA polymerase sigma factor [Oceanibaculum pacificum]|uniref:RNA polymerase subunit sigma-70 n=1 Tax=Oceanibaculum pacificum TaxID=580166 RepID=A0A154VPY1_9PROT|nr:sigma-70 family RNA polymerase sigma factor [Oceanibaculum pacificum]KZD03356.1 hypothetical protein AUP43_13185 [Oceanibaculum pacificum]